MKKVLLFCLPPFNNDGASPALSVLKAYLEKNNYAVDIKYLNLEINFLLKDFFNNQDDISERYFNKMLPFFSYLAIKNNDFNLLEKIKYKILEKNPYLHYKKPQYILYYLESFTQNIDSYIDKELSQIDFNEYLYVGFSSLFYQWIVANIITNKIINLFPKTIFVIGGFGAKNDALAFMRNFHNYHYILWGEGEIPLLNLTKYLDEDENCIKVEELTNVIYKNTNEELIIAKNQSTFVNINKIEYDYSDYYKIKKANDSIAFFEGGRGCNWRKCHFCFLNSNYKYRVKSPEKIILEIRSNISKYGVRNIAFLDNDIVGDDLMRFDKILDLLIILKSEYNFNIVLAEIITKEFNHDLIKKMKLAGFQNAQIGYESPSNRLLKKIQKKNTFASNLLFIKWCLCYDINIVTPHIIRNLLEENDDDILESIQNLYFLRFYLNEKQFKHHLANLCIANGSSYYKQFLKNGFIDKYNYSLFYNYLPSNYIDFDDRFFLLSDVMNPDYNKLWDIFSKVENFYLKNKLSYQLIYYQDFIYYLEKCNDRVVKKNIFDLNKSISWDILKQCNHDSQTINNLRENLDLKKLKVNKS